MKGQSGKQKGYFVRLDPQEYEVVARLSEEYRLSKNAIFRMAVAALDQSRDKLRGVFGVRVKPPVSGEDK